MMPSATMNRDEMLGRFREFMELVDSQEETSPIIIKMNQKIREALFKSKEIGIHYSEDEYEIIKFYQAMLGEIEGVEEHYLADAYTIELISRIPDTVNRAIKIKSMITPGNIDRIAKRYMEEACRSYIYGMYLSSVMTCRATIEYGLKKKFNTIGINSFDNSVTKLAKKAFRNKYINYNEKEFIINFYDDASQCAHGNMQVDEECYEYINKTKDIIGKLLGGAI